MASNTFTKNYADGSALTEAMLDTAYQTSQADISNLALMTTGSTAKNVLTSNGSNIAPSFQALPDPLGLSSLRNYGLQATVATGIMTISLKTKALATPSGTDIVDFTWATSGAATAAFRAVQVTSAVTLAVAASATLGVNSTSSTRVFVYGYYNSSAGSVKLAVSSLPGLDRSIPLSATAISSSSDQLYLYASASLTVTPRLLGWIQTSHNAAGAWQAPSQTAIINSYTSRFYAVSTQKIATSVGNGTAAVAIVNSISLLLTGGPVKVGLCGGPITSGNTPVMNISYTSGTSPEYLIYALERDGTKIQYQVHAVTSASPFGAHAASEVSFIDSGATPGPHSYRISAWMNTPTGAFNSFLALEVSEQ